MRITAGTSSAMLAATSVGITARVLKDADSLRAPFARIILGAAVIDDVMGIIVLSFVVAFARGRRTLKNAERNWRAHMSSRTGVVLTTA